MAGQSQFTWRKTNAPTASSRTDDIWFLDENIGWAVNSNGQILKTTDGGEKWVQQALLNKAYLRCVGFANERVGWVGTLSGERLYRTQNGGQNWDPVPNLPADFPPRICGISVVDESTAYASGTNYPNEHAGVLKTEDGGASWNVIDMRPYAALLVDIYFKSRNEGWVVGGEDVVKHPNRDPQRDDVVPTVLHTTDGGRTWTNVAGAAALRRQFPRGEWGWKIQVLDAQTNFVSLENLRDGAVLRSDDGGMTWRRLPINDRQRNANLEGIGFIDRQHGWVGGWGDIDFHGGFTSATADGGANWDDADSVGFRLNRFRFLGHPVRVGYASGDTVYKFTDKPLPIVAAARLSLRPRADRLITAGEGQSVTLEAMVPEGSRHLAVDVWERFGRHLGSVVEETNPAPGRRAFRWSLKDVSDREGGPYIARLTVDDRAESWVVMSAPAITLGFALDIKPLFRDSDRASMLNFGLDLYDYRSVKQSSDAILARLVDGSMPCDGAWPPDRVEKFRQWKDQGAAP